MDIDDLKDIFEEANDENDADNPESAEANETSEVVKVPELKRIVRNPRLKFNAERLCGERGIPILVDHFKNVKFKGKGYEVEDLDKLMSKLEHWTHRLYPSMKFEECLRHIEKLGKKRPVQTCLRKIRLDMPILNEDFTKEDDIERVGDSEPIESVDNPEPSMEDVFNSLLDNSISMESSHNKKNEMEDRSCNIQSSSIFNETNIDTFNSFFKEGNGERLENSLSTALTDEQKERMERNKKLAAEKRRARLAALKSNESVSEVIKLNTSCDAKDYVDEGNNSFLKSKDSLSEVTELEVSCDVRNSSDEGNNFLLKPDESASEVIQLDANCNVKDSLDGEGNNHSFLKNQNGLSPVRPKSPDFGKSSSKHGYDNEMSIYTSKNTASNSSEGLEPSNLYQPSALDINIDSKNLNAINVDSTEKLLAIDSNQEQLKMDDLMNLVNEE